MTGDASPFVDHFAMRSHFDVARDHSTHCRRYPHRRSYVRHPPVKKQRHSAALDTATRRAYSALAVHGAHSCGVPQSCFDDLLDDITVPTRIGALDLAARQRQQSQQRPADDAVPGRQRRPPSSSQGAAISQAPNGILMKWMARPASAQAMRVNTTTSEPANWSLSATAPLLSSVRCVKLDQADMIAPPRFSVQGWVTPRVAWAHCPRRRAPWRGRRRRRPWRHRGRRRSQNSITAGISSLLAMGRHPSGHQDHDVAHRHS